MITIDSHVPIPENSRSRFPDFPYHEMKIGDSFFVAAKDGQTIVSLQSGLSQNAKQWAKRKKSSFLFKTASWEEPNKMEPEEAKIEGVRIWRIE